MSGELVVFLHGMGAGPESWDAQVAGLPQGFEGYAPRIAGVDAPGFTLEAAARAVIADLDSRGVRKAHFCGLSLGALVATQFAIDHPGRVASLTLSGGQVHPPRLVMAVQGALTRALPSRLVAPDGSEKRHILDILTAVAAVDFRASLSAIEAPTLVLCGSRDAPNLPGSKALAAGIPASMLVIVRGGGHELNTDMPDVFTAALTQFLTTVVGEGPTTR